MRMCGQIDTWLPYGPNPDDCWAVPTVPCKPKLVVVKLCSGVIEQGGAPIAYYCETRTADDNCAGSRYSCQDITM